MRAMFFRDVAVGCLRRPASCREGYSSAARTRPRAWREQLDLLVASVADNGGQSSNASGVWTPAMGVAEGHGRMAIVPRKPAILAGGAVRRSRCNEAGVNRSTGLREPA
jgi:hypothetical protein